MLDSDDILLHRMREDDVSAMKELYNNYWKLLYISSYNVLQNKELCEDIVQEVFIDIWNNRKKISIKTSVKAYLYACARYKVFAEIKKNNKMINVTYFSTLDHRFQKVTPESELIYNELTEQINTIIEKLPEKCRNVFRLSREEQMSHKEISQHLNISTKTVENHITKALQIIRTSKKSVLGILLFIWFLN